jgi:hypothetical protein
VFSRVLHVFRARGLDDSSADVPGNQSAGSDTLGVTQDLAYELGLLACAQELLRAADLAGDDRCANVAAVDIKAAAVGGQAIGNLLLRLPALRFALDDSDNIEALEMASPLVQGMKRVTLLRRRVTTRYLAPRKGNENREHREEVNVGRHRFLNARIGSFSSNLFHGC